MFTEISLIADLSFSQENIEFMSSQKGTGFVVVVDVVVDVVDVVVVDVVVEMDIFTGVDKGTFLLSSIEFGLISWSDTELDLLISTAFAGLGGLVGTVVFLTFIFLIGSLLQLT